MHARTGNLLSGKDFPTYYILTVFLTTFLVVVLLLFYVWKSCQAFKDTNECFRLSELAGIIADLDDELTSSAKLYVDTGDSNWEKRYLKNELEQNKAINEAIASETKLYPGRALSKISDSSRKMADITNEAFKLVHSRQNDEALALLNGSEYEEQKKIYRSMTEQLTNMLGSFLKKQTDDYRFISHVSLVLALISVPLLMLSWISVSKMLRKYYSDREEFQRKLLESELRFRDLTENTSDWIWETDKEFKYTYTNPVVKHILGYEVDEILGKSIYDYTPENEIPKIRAFAEDLFQNPRPFTNFENWNLHKDGSLRLLDTAGVPIFDNDGKLAGFRGIDRDITARRHAEQALWQEQNLLNRITETSPIGITVYDKNGVIIYSNREAMSILGTPKEKITHLKYNSPEWNIADFDGNQIPEDKLPFHLIKNGASQVVDFHQSIEKEPGRRIFLSINAAPLTDKDGNFEGMVSSIEDISLHVRSNTERERLIKELQKALADVKVLSGLLPICANCKKVRDDKGYWSSVEKYIQKRSSVKFSHGFCPECFKKYCSEYFSHEEPFTAHELDTDEKDESS